MAIIHKPQQHSSHWYRSDGSPMHSIKKADGSGTRPTHKSDARKLGLLPSVTNMLGIYAKPGLNSWRETQVALATLDNPRGPNEGQDYWTKRVRRAAFDQVDAAADLGSAIHHAIDNALGNYDWNQELAEYVRPVLDWVQSTGIEIVSREHRVVNPEEGFAGTADAFFRFNSKGMGILDYKTKKTKPGQKITAYPEQRMQLAAYAATYWGEANLPDVLAANVFISTTEPGRMEVVKVQDLSRHWLAFRLTAAMWRYFNDYDPRRKHERT